MKGFLLSYIGKMGLEIGKDHGPAKDALKPRPNDPQSLGDVPLVLDDLNPVRIR
jgi:hypothetical protein